MTYEDRSAVGHVGLGPECVEVHLAKHGVEAEELLRESLRRCRARLPGMRSNACKAP